MFYSNNYILTHWLRQTHYCRYVSLHLNPRVWTPFFLQLKAQFCGFDENMLADGEGAHLKKTLAHVTLLELQIIHL